MIIYCITCLEFCEKSQMLLSAGFDSYIAIWDPSAGTLSFKLTGHECSVTGLCKMPETDYEFMSVDFDGVVRLWDVRRLCCIQSFHATDRRAEEAGELERLEPRALCPLSRDRVVISGRRIVVFDRDAGDPKMTSDWPINALAFDHRNLEIVTPIKNDLYVWDALTGQRLQIHDNVIDANITAICFGARERRIFVGDDQGSINCINAACGAQLKTLTPHAYEVAQIECMPGKVLTLSAPEKVINVHDDTDEKKAILLKRIDVSAAGVILRFAHDEREMLVISTEEGEVGWYSADFAKQIADTSQCAVNHSQAVSCCYYFKNAPLIVSADAGSAIFWSVPPLRPYDFFSKILLDVTGDEETTVAITSMSLSWPDECRLFVGTDRGAIASIDISMVVESGEASVRLWDHATGQALGTLEQGLPEGLVYNRSTDWTFPLDPHRQIQSDIDTLAEAAELNEEPANEPTRRPSRTLGADSSMYLKGQTGERILKLVQKRKMDGSLNRSTSTPDMVGQSSAGGKLNLLGPGKVPGQDYTSVSAKYLQPLQRNRMTQQKAEDWYAGSAAGSVSLPKRWRPRRQRKDEEKDEEEEQASEWNGEADTLRDEAGARCCTKTGHSSGKLSKQQGCAILSMFHLRTAQDMRSSGIPMDVISYSVALRATQDAETAMQLMEEMDARSIMPDNMIFGAAIGVCDRARDLPLALRFLEKMRLSGMQPDLVIMNSVISTSEKAGEWEQALSFLKEADRGSLHPDLVSISGAISACGKSGHWEKSLKLLGDARRRRMRLDGIAYSAAIAACQVGTQWAQAVQLLRQMQEDDIIPDENTMISAIMACRDCEQTDVADELQSQLDDFRRSGRRPGRQDSGRATRQAGTQVGQAGVERRVGRSE
ncbi:Pentatricopeptide repeat-containing protein, mitochondrial [Symbiodinium microadriaticum]|uniref:Pentatricopeptide repeat-containing protein, mitochondrial n=1 Tax=Symbiodinium microadriaticum TaxID=2951 RepID=A0A1Q9CUN2_SYMMI|nr:Pentatricopeptide repeat-containing protein, mitochondrial [Symbiodinium microadriaticum]